MPPARFAAIRSPEVSGVFGPFPGGRSNSFRPKPFRPVRGIALGIGVSPAEGSRLPDEVRQLVTRCLAGDQSAMLALVERFQGPVFGLCYRMLGQRQDAED